MEPPMLLLCLLLVTLPTGWSLRCYADIEGFEMTVCEERKGFRTCFIKYDHDGFVTGRGCATQDPMFSAACENHVMGAPHKGERICYCGTVLCNQCCAINSAFILISFLLICNFLVK